MGRKNSKVFKLSDLRTGDHVFLQGVAVNRIFGDTVSNPEEVYVLFLAMEDNQGHINLMNPNYENVRIECVNLSEIGCVKRDGELLYPKAFLTPSEKSFILNLKPILTPSTRVIKFQSFGGEIENIALLDVKSVLKQQENVHFPSFKANSLYKGLNPGEEYTLASLGIVLGDE